MIETEVKSLGQTCYERLLERRAKLVDSFKMKLIGCKAKFPEAQNRDLYWAMAQTIRARKVDAFKPTQANLLKEIARQQRVIVSRETDDLPCGYQDAHAVAVEVASQQLETCLEALSYLMRQRVFIQGNYIIARQLRSGFAMRAFKAVHFVAIDRVIGVVDEHQERWLNEGREIDERTPGQRFIDTGLGVVLSRKTLCRGSEAMDLSVYSQSHITCKLCLKRGA